MISQGTGPMDISWVGFFLVSKNISLNKETKQQNKTTENTQPNLHMRMLVGLCYWMMYQEYFWGKRWALHSG